MDADFVRYYTRITISQCYILYKILHQNHNFLRLKIWSDVSQNHKTSWLQILWHITPEPQYLMVADFMRYYTITTISHGCRFSDILHKTPNNSWLKISWGITPKPQYLMDADCMRYYNRTRISHGSRFRDILRTQEPQFVVLSFCLFVL